MNLSQGFLTADFDDSANTFMRKKKNRLHTMKEEEKKINNRIKLDV